MTQAMVLVDLEWESDARAALEHVAKEGKPFTAYDLTTKAELRNPPSSGQWGALFRHAAEDGIIRRVGFAESLRPGRNGGLCRVWKVAA
ncbi:MAG: hypothetical protein M3536_00030 [Actinomycetota bacterium]|nr:hypothetical protein [Actinomycetota bacterium]